ncbi:hypothetical protein GWK47_030605 [Chionoecetes opilio]|uniref:Uncharacterized protein n=1 Tax=Chionoecetes opilio TaxID=41210 RepID=A0A8J4YK04_CHIOP|nr:hypothetical protein GWK47_030605 [Chionoecetes opilio]
MPHVGCKSPREQAALCYVLDAVRSQRVRTHHLGHLVALGALALHSCAASCPAGRGAGHTGPVPHCSTSGLEGKVVHGEEDESVVAYARRSDENPSTARVMREFG